MPGKRGWTWACGCGCLSLLLLAGGLTAGAIRLVDQTRRELEAADRSAGTLYDRLGRASDYRPASIELQPDRLEAFLAVRAQAAGSRGELERAIAQLTAAETNSIRWSLNEVVRTFRSGFGLLPRIGAFVRQRNDALLEQRMGHGEYALLYSLIYYVELGKSPADGPPFVLVGYGEERGNDDEPDEFAVRERRLEQTTRRLNRTLLPVLRAWRADADESDWRDTLAREIAAMEADPHRIAWRDGLPPRLRRSIEPYASRLEQSYSESCNPLELGPYLEE